MTEPSAAEFADIALALHNGESVVETVDLVLEHALQALDCKWAGVMFVHGGKKIETAAATDPLVEELDRIHSEVSDAPALRVLNHGMCVVVADTLYEERWPEWAEQVAEKGVRSMLSVGLSTGTSVVGILNLYDDKPSAFDLDDQAVAVILARHAAVALAAARQAENLWIAIDARKLVGQAQGILMERFDLTADQAFSVLMRYSQDKNMKLRAVAELLISQRRLPD